MDANLDIFKIILESGLVVKTVLLILIALSIYSWSIIFYKRKVLKQIEAENTHFAEIFKNNSSLPEISSRVGDYLNSTHARVFKEGYDELQKINDKIKTHNNQTIKEYISAHSSDSIIRAMNKGESISNQLMDHRLSPLASISSVAPFIGLFGTVWGIIDSFRGLSSGGGTIEAVAPGIAEALVATAVGLFAAIPANWYFNIFSNRIQLINSQMETFKQDFINLVERIIFSQAK